MTAIAVAVRTTALGASIATAVVAAAVGCCYRRWWHNGFDVDATLLIGRASPDFKLETKRHKAAARTLALQQCRRCVIFVETKHNVNARRCALFAIDPKHGKLARHFAALNALAVADAQLARVKRHLIARLFALRQIDKHCQFLARPAVD